MNNHSNVEIDATKVMTFHECIKSFAFKNVRNNKWQSFKWTQNKQDKIDFRPTEPDVPYI